MTPPTRDDLALYAMGHFDGDPDAIERWLADDPDTRARLAAEADLELFLRDVARAATFCAVCHDLVRSDCCTECGTAVDSDDEGESGPVPPEPEPDGPVALVAVTAPELPRPRPARAPALLAAITLATAVVAAALLAGSRPESAAEAPLPTEPSMKPSVAPPLPPPAPTVVPPAQTKTAPTRPSKKLAPTVVELRIVTTPAGVAVVLDHQDLGLTPLVVKVPRSTTPIELSLQHVGYHQLVRQLALRADTRLALTLTSLGLPPVHESKFADDQCMKCHKPQLGAPRGGPSPMLLRGPSVPAAPGTPPSSPLVSRPAG